MWNVQKNELEPQRVIRYRIEQSGQILTVRQFFTLLAEDAAMRSYYSQLLAESPFQGFFWEHPPLAESGLDTPYEFVLVSGDELLRKAPQPTAFAEYFQAAEPAVSFSNRSGDARLVVPAPLGPPSQYTHLAVFVRQAPEAQQNAFWRLVAEEVLRVLPSGKHWLSTAGMGVPWLHVRLDTHPKYYRYPPYRHA